MNDIAESAGVYIHMPFCRKICPYCDFYSIIENSELKREYLDAVRKEFEIRAHDFRDFTFDSVYFGGGTPSLLKPGEVESIIETISAHYRISEYPEISMECNPSSVDYGKFSSWRNIGVNRISLGAQSFQDDNLKTLGRIHNARTAIDSYSSARSAGFENISIDLIYGLPGQTEGNWATDIEQAIRLKPDHISAYNLIIEPGTPFGELHAEGKLVFPEDEVQSNMYYMLLDRSDAARLNRYELSNFAIDGKRCEHNLKYWHSKPYLGLGPSAVSCDGRTRWKNIANLNKYISDIAAGRNPIEYSEKVERDRALEEAVMMGLRLTEGISIDNLLAKFGYDILKEKKSEIKNLVDSGYLENENGELRITRAGLFLSDEITVRLI